MSLFVQGLRNVLAGPFTFSVGTGECLAITGASGAGKTVMLRMIADLDPHEGTVVFEGTDRAMLPAPQWRRLAALVPARSGWWDESVAAHFQPESEAARQALASDLLLPEALFARSIEEASTGEALALAGGGSTNRRRPSTRCPPRPSKPWSRSALPQVRR